MQSGRSKEAALRESAERYRVAFNNAAIGKAIVAPEGQWLEVNEALCRLVGYSRELLLQMTFQEMTHPDDLEVDLAYVQQLMSGEIETFQMEKRYFHGQGHIVWVLLSTTLIRHPDGSPKYFVSEMQDITKGKELERALQDQEEHYRLALESAETGTWELDLRTGKEIWSEQLLELYGIRSGEVEASYEVWLKLVHPADRERMAKSTDELLDRRATRFRDEFRIVHPQKGVRWMLTQGRILYGPDGEAERMLGTVVDIDDRKSNEVEKERLANHNYALLNSTGEGIYGIDRQGCCTFINRAAARMLGFEREEVLGRNMHSLIHHSHADGSPYPEEECPMYRAFRLNEGIRVSDDVLWRKDGTQFPVDYSSYPILGEGEAGGSVITFVDVTERMRAERALAESEERYRRVYENAAVGVIQITLDGRVLDANDRLCELLDYSREELLALDVARITHRDDWEDVERQSGALLRGDVPLYKVDRQYLRKDGSVIWVHLSVSLVRNQLGDPQYFIGVVEDITARREAERVLEELMESLEQQVEERTAQLSASNRELEAFAYSVSHDLRAPLRGIDGFAQVLLEEYADRLDDAGKRYLERIRNGATRMGNLINDLLELSRLSRAQLRPKEVDLSALARRVLASLRDSDPGREVHVHVEEGLQAQGDERLLYVVLENLLANAWKFTAGTERPRIALEREARGTSTAFVVRDNGAGFDMQYAAKLFVPFQRLHLASEFEGSGIGLATVQRIIQRHGGAVWAEAEVGRGASVYFTLP